MSEPTAYRYVPSSTSDATPGMCPHCGFGHVGTCPRIKYVEYHQNGTIKRIEFHALAPVADGHPIAKLTVGELIEKYGPF